MTGEKVGKLGALGLLLGAAMTLGACNRDSGSTPAPAPPIKPTAPVVQKRGPTAAEQTAGMVEAAVQGKSQAPVLLKFDLAQRPKVGQPLEINLAVIPQVDANPATIQVKGGDDVSVAGAGQFDIAAAEAGAVYRQSVNVTPTAEGVLLVGVSVSLKHDEVTDVTAFSIPIIADK
ncbi:MAG TPA: hypothetical protein VGH12_02710 [Steroidobacteraceae bacterium]|jgi:hypothetical protein